MELEFEWDEDKANANFKKHGVRFEEAKSVFNDPNSLTIVDFEHSQNEDRYIDIGFSSQGRLIVVIYTERGTRIRIISSRKATTSETKAYEQS